MFRKGPPDMFLTFLLVIIYNKNTNFSTIAAVHFWDLNLNI